MSSCGPAVPPGRGEGEAGLAASAAILLPLRLRGPRASVPETDLRSRKVAANFLARFPRPFSQPDPPPCGAGNSEGRSAGRDGE